MELLRRNKIKVHRLLCLELKKFVDRISDLFSALDSARPRCKPGIQALCSLHETIDRANLLIQHCSDSSKLYLAITAHAILSRGKRIRNALALSMNQIRNVVPPSLAAKISGIQNQLISAKFHLEPSEHEAEIALLSLLKPDVPASSTRVQWELKTLQLAALRLNITSPSALLMERRAIRRLLSEVHQVHPRTEKILGHLLHLLNKHGSFIWRKSSDRVDSHHEMELELKCNGVQTPSENRSISEPPEEFKCPISGRLFYDPVVIASGETFEQAWIVYWFSEGKLTCPVTCRRLDNFALTSNVAMKSLVMRWCSTHGISISEPPQEPTLVVLKTMETSTSSSTTSFGSYIDGLQLPVSSLSLHSSDCDNGLDPPTHQPADITTTFQDQMCHSPTTTSRDGNCGISLSKLSPLSWGSQCEIVERFSQLIKENDKSWQSKISESSLLLLIRFLKCACERCDMKLQKDGAEVLFALLSLSRIELPPCQEDVIYMLSSMLDSELSLQALAILEVLSRKWYYSSRMVAFGVLPCILKAFDDRIRESHKLAMKILCNLSNNGNDVGTHIVYLDCVQKLTSLLADPELAGYCIQLVGRLCETAEARSTVATTVAKNKSCTDSFAILLEFGTPENQEHALDVLMALCHEPARFHRLILTESIVQYLANILENGKPGKGLAIALELLSLQQHRFDPSPRNKKGLSHHQPAGKEVYLKALTWVRKRASRGS